MARNVWLALYIPIAIAFVFFAGNAAQAFGNDNEWESGWAMGVSEAIITNGPGNEIYVTCGNEEIDQSGIRFMLLGEGPKGHAITLTFEGEDPEDFSIWDGQITSNCHACMATYETVIEKLRNHSSVHVRFENGESARFPLKGSSNAIQKCVPDFAR